MSKQPPSPDLLTDPSEDAAPGGPIPQRPRRSRSESEFGSWEPSTAKITTCRRIDTVREDFGDVLRPTGVGAANFERDGFAVHKAPASFELHGGRLELIRGERSWPNAPPDHHYIVGVFSGRWRFQRESEEGCLESTHELDVAPNEPVAVRLNVGWFWHVAGNGIIYVGTTPTVRPMASS